MSSFDAYSRYRQCLRSNVHEDEAVEGINEQSSAVGKKSLEYGKQLKPVRDCLQTTSIDMIAKDYTSMD